MWRQAGTKALQYRPASALQLRHRGYLCEDVPRVAEVGDGLDGEVERDACDGVRVGQVDEWVCVLVGWPIVHLGCKEARRAVGDGDGHSLKPLEVPEGLPELSKSSGTPEQVQVLLKVPGKTERGVVAPTQR